MKKCFVLDTNVIIYEPRSIFAFDDNEVVIPLVVLDEIDKHKNGDGQLAKHARMAIRSLDKLRDMGKLNDGVKTEHGGIIRVELGSEDNMPSSLDSSLPDNKIISVALGLTERKKDISVVMVSRDINVRIKCDSLGVKSVDYTTDMVIEDLDAVYRGYTDIVVDKEDIDSLYNDGSIGIPGDTFLYPNQYVNLKSNTDPSHSALSRLDGSHLIKVKIHKNIWGVSPRNREQTFALDALFNPAIKLVTLTGIAGTGKTLISALAGVAQTFDDGVYDKLILTRPIVPLGRDLGFLPGTIEDKMQPWLAPLHDNLNFIFSNKGRYFLDSQMADGLIDIAPLTYVRGRSIPNSYIILDEGQNASRHEIKTLVTRAGEGSKVIIIGDVQQVDTPGNPYDNGLSYVIEKFKDDDIHCHIHLSKGERSELATKAAEKL